MAPPYSPFDIAVGNDRLPLLQLIAQNQRRVASAQQAQPIRVGALPATPMQGGAMPAGRAAAPAPMQVAAMSTPASQQQVPSEPAQRSGIASIIEGMSPDERRQMTGAMLGGAAANLSNLMAGRPNAGVGELLLAAGAGTLGGQQQAIQGIRLGRQDERRGQLLERQIATAEAKAQQEMAQAEQVRRILEDPSVPVETKRIIQMSMAGVPAAGIEAMVPKAQSTIGKLQADLAAGRINQEQYNLAASRIGAPLTTINMPSQLDPLDAPIEPIDLARLQTADGQPLPVGTTFRQAQQAGAIPIEAAKAASEAQMAASQEAQRRTQREVSGNVVLQEIGRGLELIEGGYAAGPVVGRGADIPVVGPGTPAGQLEKLTETIRANVGFDKLQQMREASPTGGALGQVSERENTLLQSVLGNLDITQPAEVVDANLRRLANIYLDTIHGTPEQIQAMVESGEISPDDAAPLMQRHPLPFDEQGRPIQQKPGDAQPTIDFTADDVRFTAQSEGLTIDQVLESVAKSRGLTVDQIRQKLGL